ncbi:MAG: hypothetical protein OXK81_05210 [Chloroflexota bacterium]|nr:hypothetical protein [Chloroflexota bacterium]
MTLAIRHGFALVAVMAVILIGAALVWRAGERGAPTPAAASPGAAGPESAPTLPAEHSAGGEPTLTPAAQPSIPLWRVVDENAAPYKPPYPADWSEAGRSLVDVSGAASAANAWREGDRVSMLLPQVGASYEGGIDRIYEALGHSRSARGWTIGDDGRKRRFVVTVGPTRVFAYVDTAEGSYELVADTRLGWLLPTSSMLAGIDGIDFREHRHIVPGDPSGSIDAEGESP